MAKWTRAEVLMIAKQVRDNGHEGRWVAASIALAVADMLESLAPPPDEPRRWQVGDLLRWDGRNCYFRQLADGTARLHEIDGGWMGWVKVAELRDAIPLKLVPMEEGR